MNRIDPSDVSPVKKGTNELRRSPKVENFDSLFGKELQRCTSETDLLINKAALKQLQNM